MKRLAISSIVWFFSLAWRLRRRGAFTAESVRRIAVVFTGGIGNLMMTLPALHALRKAYPSAGITLIALPSSGAGLLEGEGVVDTVRIYTDKRGPRDVFGHKLRLIRLVRDAAPDLVWFPGSTPGWLAPLCAFLGGARWTLGGYYEAGLIARRSAFIDIPYSYHTKHESAVNAEMLARIGVPGADKWKPLNLSPDEIARAKEVFRETGVSPDEPVVGLHPGSGEAMRFKRWGAGNFAAVGDALAARAKIVVFGGRTEALLAREVTARMRQPAVALVRDRTLREVAALMSIGCVVITNDSGLSYVAEAVGAHVIVIGCGTLKEEGVFINGPFGPRHTILLNDSDCKPCFRRGAGHVECNQADYLKCLKTITPEQVTAAALLALGAGREYFY